MNLKEIQTEAKRIRARNATGRIEEDSNIFYLSVLIDHLAARQQEFENLIVQSRKASEAFKDTPTYRAAQKQVYEQNVSSNMTVDQQNDMKTHVVTVQYRATIDMNSIIENKIKRIFGIPGSGCPVPCVYPTVEVDYVRIISDRDGV